MNQSIPINYHLNELQLKEKLSERAKNICLDNGIDSLYLLLKFYREHRNFISLRSCGIKTNAELIAVSEKYFADYEVLDEIDSAGEHHRNFEEYKLMCFEYFKLGSHEAEAFRHAFLEERFPFFQFILLIIRNFLGEREYYIFEHNFGYFENRNKLTLQAIGKKFDITRERARQIALDLTLRIKRFLSPFADELNFIEKHLQYNLKRYKDFIRIDDDAKNLLNNIEELQCTARFYAFGFSILYHNTYSFFQEISENYKNYYLVNRKLAEQFKFSEFYVDLNQKISTLVHNSYTVDFRHYVRTFYRPGKFSYFERIVEICRQIAFGEFGLRCNIQDELLIPRNTKIKLSEHIVQILAETGRPMHLKEISESLKSRRIRESLSIESLRSAIISNPDIAALGKSSTYALSSWQQIKRGTIKQLAKEYLEEQEKPVHISVLTKYINQFRKTKEKNVYSNLKLDRNGTYTFFKGGYISLSSKDNSSFTQTNRQLTLL